MTTSTVTRQPLLCRLNLHHTWKRHHNPEGGSYRQCSRCGKDHPSIGSGPGDYLHGVGMSG
jgi:hypothetical protein